MASKWFKRWMIIMGILAICGYNSIYFGGTPNMDKHWGEAYETAKANQVLNPAAENNLEPVEGMDGVSAEKQIDTYHKGIGCDQKQENVNILKLR